MSENGQGTEIQDSSNDNLPGIPQKREEFAFGYILEVLTQGLYPNVLDVLREYVQNSYDAIIKHRTAYRKTNYKLKINITDNSVMVADNGIGMDETQIKKYRYVGYSEKQAHEAAGFRGIGKLSGISVAESLIVTSKVQGSTKVHTIRFNARQMLEEILLLKRRGRNKPLNDLIRDNTEFDTSEDEADQHFTFVELRNIRPDHSVLLDSVQVAQYVGKICPVPFNPAFDHGPDIDRWLLNNVADYVYVPHVVNDQAVYKPYVNNLEKPLFFNIEESDGGEPIAFGWACQNRTQQQIPEISPRGITFRIKNISIGDARLARSLLWHQSGHLAYWFLGEIHIVDQGVIPSSERSNFEDNQAKQHLIARTEKLMIGSLIKKARETSGMENAEKKRRDLQELVQNTELSLREGTLPKEILVYEAAKLISATDKLRGSRGRFGGSKKAAVEKLLNTADDLVSKLNLGARSKTEFKGAFDIKEEIKLSRAEEKFYDLVVNCLTEIFTDQPDRFAEAINKLHERMLQSYPKK
jgi:Histidine kinase-, DNA gyrase B-, and HSP90-like ATPase